jgi:hypothetical protein
MKKAVLAVRIALEVVGVAALLYWAFVSYLGHMFKDFAGGSCTDTEQRMIASPDGKHTVKSFHRVCGSTYGFDFV